MTLKVVTATDIAQALCDYSHPENEIERFECNACGTELQTADIRYGALEDNLLKAFHFGEHVLYDHAGRADILSVKTTLFAITR